MATLCSRAWGRANKYRNNTTVFFWRGNKSLCFCGMRTYLLSSLQDDNLEILKKNGFCHGLCSCHYPCHQLFVGCQHFSFYKLLMLLWAFLWLNESEVTWKILLPQGAECHLCRATLRQVWRGQKGNWDEVQWWKRVEGHESCIWAKKTHSITKSVCWHYCELLPILLHACIKGD
jgi:hypothetical protein